MSDSLSNYKPQVSVADTLSIPDTAETPEDTFYLWKQLIAARKLQDASFLMIGKALKLFRDNKLYKHLDFENFTQFLASEEISFSREKAYLYIRTYELYVNQLDFKPDELSKMGIARLMMLAPLIRNSVTKEEALGKIKEMEGMRYGDFVRQVKQETNTDGMPEVFFSKEADKWFVNYYNDKTVLNDLGDFKK